MSTGHTIMHLVGGPLHGQALEVEHDWRKVACVTEEPLGAIDGYYIEGGARWTDEHGTQHRLAYYEESST